MFIIHMKVWRSGYKIRKILRFGFVYVDSLVTNLLVQNYLIGFLNVI